MRSVMNFETIAVRIFPNIVLRIVMIAKAPYAPVNTVHFLYLMAITIARKNVLSPISQTKMALKDVINEVHKPAG